MELRYCQYMKRLLSTMLFMSGLMLFGAGCVDTLDQEIRDSKLPVMFPVENYTYRARYKRFGEFIDDRFRGYHVGDDLETKDAETDVAVYALADGRVTFADWVSGYGGVIVINHAAMCGDVSVDDCERVSAVYGHLNAQTFQVSVGDEVQTLQTIGFLGAQGPQTDGERAHLHYALYKGEDVRLAGYVATTQALDDYINPLTFFLENDVMGYDKDMRTLSRLTEPSGRDTFPLDMEIPGVWDVEWVPSLEAWNLYDTRGAGTARERSQIFIRYFDASDFLTLSTVTIHSAMDTAIGDENYVARRYDIEKKPDAAAFKDQPSWRNERHVVTDFRGEEGFTRYFVVAANPDLDANVYDRILQTMHIVTENDSDERSN